MWVLGLYKLSWPANGSFVYVIFFFLFFFFFFFFCYFFFVFYFLRGKTGNVKGERGSWGGGGRRGYIVLCIHVNILTVMDRKTVVANGTKQ